MNSVEARFVEYLLLSESDVVLKPRAKQLGNVKPSAKPRNPLRKFSEEKLLTLGACFGKT